MMHQQLLFICYLLLSIINADIITRRKHDNINDISSAHVVVSKEGPPPSPQEYTISKLEKNVVCDARGDKTWSKWAAYDLDGVCSRLQYYGEIEGQCETDCNLLCPQGFYEVAKEACGGLNALSGIHVNGKSGSGYYRQCVGRYKCTQTSYNYWVHLKWWQFLIWEVVIVILGCCFFGLACGCCIRCYFGASSRRVNPFRAVVNEVRQPQRRRNNNNNQQRRQGNVNGNQAV